MVIFGYECDNMGNEDPERKAQVSLGFLSFFFSPGSSLDFRISYKMILLKPSLHHLLS